MATTVTSDEAIRRAQKTLDALNVRTRGGRGGGGRGPNGGNGPNGRGPGGGGGGHQDGWTPGRYRIGVLVGMASILMMFSALASAYIVRSGLPGRMSSMETPIPSFIWISTALIIASSATMSSALRALRKNDESSYSLWLGLTLVLGIGFLSSQLLAWRQLVGQGLYLASNPYSSFFYVLTGLHGVHLLGGIAGLVWLMFYGRGKRAGRAGSSGALGAAKRGALADMVGIYWHFMDGLWVFLFLILFLWR